MKATFKPPRTPYNGNLLWDASKAQKSNLNIQSSLERLRKLGYWVSPFPEGDGITFLDEKNSKKDIEILNDFRLCFDWLEISLDLTFSKENVAKQPAQSKISDEKNIVLSKHDIGLLQLEDAIELFLAGKRISVITLAGAADGIFSGLLKQKGKASAAEETWKSIEQFRLETGLAFGGAKTEKDAFGEWNKYRNRLKHHDDRDEDMLELSAFDQAYYAIQRANLNAEKLGLIAKNRQSFENWLIENIYM